MAKIRYLQKGEKPSKIRKPIPINVRQRRYYRFMIVLHFIQLSIMGYTLYKNGDLDPIIQYIQILLSNYLA